MNMGELFKNTIFTNDQIQILEKVNDILFKTKDKKKNVIFIYTPQKVGSTSLVSSIRISALSKFSVLHIHDDLMLSVLTGYTNVTVNDVIMYNKEIGKNVYVIDIYRSPIERKISEYFEKISSYHFNNSEDNINSYNIDKIVNRFNKLFPHLAKKDYFQEIYNINIPEKFDFEKKFLLVEENGIKYIKIRLMDSKQWNKILSEILNTEIVVVNDYETKNKKIGELYNKFKSEYKIPNNLLVMISNCKILNYYLSENEKINYIKSWENKINSNEVVSYTDDEYNFYMNICIENKFYNDFQNDHYIDVGCVCKGCSIKRSELFQKAKNGENVTEKIIHNEIISNIKKNIIKKNNRKIKIKKSGPVNGLLSNIINTKR